MNRRAFVKNTCIACGGSLILGLFLESCATLPMVQASPSENKISILKTQFLQGNLLIARSNKIDSDILVRKKENVFIALRMMCTHEEQPLTATTDQLHCPSHGSSFDLEGNVTREPASRPLRKYMITETENEIIIHLNQFL
jgi:Rieske Fe-S protein